MYKNILLPTDGSRLSENAARAGIALARALGAKVMALHVIPDASEVVLERWAHGDEDFAGKFSEALASRGELYVEEVRDAARRAGVACECRVARGRTPHEGILEEAIGGHHDLIVMASHGHNEASGDVFGSETALVMKLGATPVLVHHVPRPAARAGGA